MPKVRIASSTPAAREVLLLVLEPLEGQFLPAFDPGSHIDVEVAPGIVRQYSLCPPAQSPNQYRIAIQREVHGRGGSRAAHDLLRAGAVIEIGEPRNLFPLISNASHSLLFAGGIGITPLLAMAGELARKSSRFSLHYSAKSPDYAAFVSELKSSTFAEDVHFYFSNEGNAFRLNIDNALAAATESTHLYICGSSRYADAIISQARVRGLSESNLHQELFAPKPVSEDGNEFVVRTKSGASVIVPSDLSIVQALEKQGIEIPTSCEQGICGTCLTNVIEGTPDHRDSYLTQAERDSNKQILPCCSRSLTSLLVLDL